MPGTIRIMIVINNDQLPDDVNFMKQEGELVFNEIPTLT